MRAPPRDRYGRPLPPGSRNELEEATEPARVVRSARQACRHAIALFDARRFFEAHEFFEYVWKADDVADPDRRFWKGVTQVAVGCCHVQRGNAPGAVALFERAITHLRDYPSPHCGIDTSALIASSRRLADRVRRLGASAGLEFPRFPTAR